MTDNLNTTEALDAIGARLGEKTAIYVDSIACIFTTLNLLALTHARPEVAKEMAGIAINATKEIANHLGIDPKEIDAVCKMMADDIKNASPT